MTKRERTRESLIAAASEIVAEKGFERTTLEEVAARAGMTRGAFYGNFKDKHDLFMAVAKAQWEPIVPEFEPGASLSDQMRELGRAVWAAAERRRPKAVGAASFHVYALTNPEMGVLVETTSAETYRWAEEQILQHNTPDSLPMPPAQFVRVLHALTEGLLSTHFLTPREITEEVMVAAFEALVT